MAGLEQIPATRYPYGYDTCELWMLNDGLLNVESMPYNIHEPLMHNGKLFNVEFTLNISIIVCRKLILM